MSLYTKHFNTKKTPQTQPVPILKQVENNAGGFVFKISPEKHLLRFLILGNEGGTYYQTEKELTINNTKSIISLIQTNGKLVVDTLVDVSLNGRAAKQNSTIYTLALACTYGNAETKKLAYDAIPQVLRTGTMLFTFINNIQSLRGWSRGLRKAVAKFYLEKTDLQVATQLVKYQQRDGVSHRDVLGLSHPKANTPAKNQMFSMAVGKPFEVGAVPNLVQSFIETRKEDLTEEKLIELIQTSKLPREAVPTQFLNNVNVWNALLPSMQLNALVRNLGKMTQVGLLKTNLSAQTNMIVKKLTNVEEIKKSRLHPMTILQALYTYQEGQGFKGNLTWKPVPKIIEALNEAFILSFGNVESTGKNILLALDCSPSMTSPISNSSLSCRAASAGLASVFLNTEKNVDVVGFSGGGIGAFFDRSETNLKSLNIHSRTSLTEAMREIDSFPWGSTDCSLPMLHAIKSKLMVDTFIVVTDNETYSGQMHPYQALEQYRKRFNKDAKLIVIGMTATEFSIAKQDDSGMLDVVGFDTNTPNIMSEFIKGNL